MWVVLIGSHCVGKTTVGRILASRLGWIFDGEVGDHVVGRSGHLPSLHCDEEILSREKERDFLRKGICRVVETWHFGNAAWSSFRQRENLANDMIHAARDATESEQVYCFELTCQETERVKRYNAMDSSLQLNLPGANTLESTDMIGSRAATMANKCLGSDNFGTIETAMLSPSQVADTVHCQLLDLLAGRITLFPSLESARKTVHQASQLIPELAAVLPENKLTATHERFPSLVIVVEGLDGSGKTTAVARLCQHVGSGAVTLRSPPRILDRTRRTIEDHSSYLAETEAYWRFKRAFYSLGNYTLSQDLKYHRNPCVVDRFVTSTMAYTLGATDAKNATAPEPKAVWPDDIPNPDIVLVLELTEEVRQSRIQERSRGVGIGVAEWELESQRNAGLAPSILYHMKHIHNGPNTVVVDVSMSDFEQNFRRIASALVDHGIGVAFRNVVGPGICDAMLEEFANTGNLPVRELNRYKWRNTNTLYSSRRHDASVCFLESPRVTELCRSASTAIAAATSQTGWSVQGDVLPVFSYQEGGQMAAHRDVNLTSLVDYCAVVILSKRGVDFDGGALYINGSVQDVDEHGQCMSPEVLTKRQYFDDLDQGDIVVFRNSQCIHGVERVHVKSGRGRITTSFRI